MDPEQEPANQARLLILTYCGLSNLFLTTYVMLAHLFTRFDSRSGSLKTPSSQSQLLARRLRQRTAVHQSRINADRAAL